jgi:hypothetical protein
MLLVTAKYLDISYGEAINYFNNIGILGRLTHISTYLFGNSNIALRLPFIVAYFISFILFYKVSQHYLINDLDQIISLSIFMFLPGVVSAGLLVNTSILVILLILLYIYIYNKTKKHSYILLIIFLFIDNSFAILFISLFFYSLKQKDNKLLVLSLILFAISMYLYGFDSGGKPKGYFIDTIAIYASIFSILIFFYFLYSLYQTFINKKVDILWYIATTAFLFSLILSFRQSIKIEEFAPFVVIAIPITVKIFLNSYRVRLPQFRSKHKIALRLSILVLFINTSILLYNKPLYLYLDKPNKHFLYNYNFAEDIANKLKEKNIYKINTFDEDLRLRLKFYGIQSGGDKYLSYNIPSYKHTIINIKYYNKIINSVYISE